MTQIKLMHAKLHRVTVTSANVDYVGSISIDQDLMDKVGILPLEEVDVINLNNGKRWSTYAIAGVAGSGEICPNGGAALLCQPGDLLIIIAYEYRDRAEVMQKGHQAQIIVADEQNHCREFIDQALIPQGDRLQFYNSAK
ncbi:aspartate 1-decarboxylase [Chondrocystis sp. NIES-4102]|nr:aspartate 1-decarboxylase [Chondrocystis sp. NIES-4102]